MKMKYVFFENQNQNGIFQKLKLYNMKCFEIFCVCVNELEQSTTNLSFTFYLKIKILTLTKLDSSLENLLLKIFSPS